MGLSFKQVRTNNWTKKKPFNYDPSETLIAAGMVPPELFVFIVRAWGLEGKLQVFSSFGLKTKELTSEDDIGAKTSFVQIVNSFGAMRQHAANTLDGYIEKGKKNQRQKRKKPTEIPPDQDFPPTESVPWVNPEERIEKWGDENDDEPEEGSVDEETASENGSKQEEDGDN